MVPKLREFGIDLPHIMELYNVATRLIAKAMESTFLLRQMEAGNQSEGMIYPKSHLGTGGFRGSSPDFLYSLRQWGNSVFWSTWHLFFWFGFLDHRR